MDKWVLSSSPGRQLALASYAEEAWHWISQLVLTHLCWGDRWSRCALCLPVGGAKEWHHIIADWLDPRLHLTWLIWNIAFRRCNDSGDSLGVYAPCPLPFSIGCIYFLPFYLKKRNLSIEVWLTFKIWIDLMYTTYEFGDKYVSVEPLPQSMP